MKSCKQRAKQLSLMLLFILGACLYGGGNTALAAGEITLYTPYTSISVPPGEVINYPLEVKNNTNSVITVPLQINSLPSGWSTKLNGGGWQLKEVSVKPGESESVTLEVTVPLKVDKGSYRFQLSAGSMASLQLTVDITEKGTYQTELTTDQANLEGHADSTFTYTVNLQNRTANKQNYALSADAQAGWDVTFTSGGKQVSSVEIEAGASQSITVDVKPPAEVTEGSFSIPIRASNSSTSSELALEAVITGSYGLELTTPSGLLSTNVNAGGSKTIELLVKNTGTAPLSDINLSADTPVDWEVSFNPKTIENLPAGKSTTVEAKLTSSDKAIAGDYVTSLKAAAAEASSDAQFRVAVKGSMLWGWIGVLVILAILGGIYVLIRKYGRR
ncbi:NEW3 domain-containing protein [Paenibacillus sp. FSL H8-0457]|uniref:NEW3 domain-containing protein n=1 Tax=Bacillales TaxID=1385 RepID=UPI0003E2A631|nr:MULTISPECIES: NEW3 domain-containing protein [Paenibacillus]ETT57459.1 S-layer domain-containing protein [Paenibacillus sp. FSL H8-457]MCM3256287.1 NEW3 domain-containing protein [Paenibacillus lautus]